MRRAWTALVLILALTLALAPTACSSGDSTATTQAPRPESTAADEPAAARTTAATADATAEAAAATAEAAAATATAAAAAATAAAAAAAPLPDDTPEPAESAQPSETTGTPDGEGPTTPTAWDSVGLQENLSTEELECAGNDAHTLLTTLTRQQPVPAEELKRLLDCLSDENIDRIFLLNLAPTGTRLGPETSDCIGAGLEVIDTKRTMLAGAQGQPGESMAGAMTMMMVLVACMNDAEYEANAPLMDLRSNDRSDIHCLMRELDGPGNMASAMLEASTGDRSRITTAAVACRIDTGTSSP